MKLNTLIHLSTAVLIGTTIPSFAQDIDAGKKVFKKCAACHKIGEGAKNGAGPQLNGIIGRVAGTADGFKYGKDLVAAGEKGLVWTSEEIDAYITDPKKYLRAYLENPKAKAKMTFKLKKEDQRKDVVAYLASLQPENATEETTSD